jgi:hypothetical protein
LHNGENCDFGYEPMRKGPDQEFNKVRKVAHAVLFYRRRRRNG